MKWFSVLGLVGLTVAANVEVILDARYQGANHSSLSRIISVNKIILDARYQGANHSSFIKDNFC